MRRQTPRGRRRLLAESLEQRRLLAVTKISFEDFADPDVLDFSSAAVGSISETAELFRDFGISQISATGSNSVDTFDARPNASRALWADDTGLRIVDPGTAGLRRDELAYTVEFVNDQTRFGVGVHDEPGVYVLQLFADDVDVGTFAFSSGGDLTQKYIESSEAFDKVVIHYTSRTIDQGFALDNLTLEKEATQPPDAADDQVEIDEDSGPIVFDVISNDTDPDGDLDASTTSVKDGPAHGELINLGDGTFNYTPSRDFHGTDSFVYTICDEQGNCDEAEVTITVNSVVDLVLEVGPRKPLNLRSNGTVSLIIFSTQTAEGELEDFDATQVDTSTIHINGQLVDPRAVVVEDVDADGDLDLVLRLMARDLARVATTSESEVDLFFAAESRAGDPLTGSSSVALVGPVRGPGEHRSHSRPMPWPSLRNLWFENRGSWGANESSGRQK